jgi:Flp pilus assembly pilin Flp
LHGKSPYVLIEKRRNRQHSKFDKKSRKINMLDKTNTSKNTPTQSLNKKLKKQKGATMIEYAIVVAAVVGIAAVVFTDDTSKGMGQAVDQIITNAANKATGADSGSGSTP